MASPKKVVTNNHDFLAACFQSFKGGKPAIDYDRLALITGMSSGGAR
jgi:hypothetical protein